MAILRRTEVAAPSIPQEEVEVAAWGGAVVVRAMLLEQYLELTGLADQGAYEHILRTLALTVLDADGEPMLDVEGWRRFAAGHRLEALRLYEVANRLSGGGKGDAEKN